MELVCFILGIICLFDYSERRIPNRLIFLLLIIGLGETWLEKGLVGIGRYALSLLLVTLCFYFLFAIGTIGAGDVKLYGVLAGMLPWTKIVCFLFISLAIAALFSLFILLKKHQLLPRINRFALFCQECCRQKQLMQYPVEKGEGLVLSGPILFSFLLYVGGFY